MSQCLKHDWKLCAVGVFVRNCYVRHFQWHCPILVTHCPSLCTKIVSKLGLYLLVHTQYNHENPSTSKSF